MRAEIITSGTELLLGEIVDTNAAWLSQQLAELGIDLYRRTTVGDNLERLAAAIGTALAQNDLVILSGGLGPTVDDLTAEALAKALGVSLALDDTARRWVAEWVARRGREAQERDLKQARLPEGARALPNRRGSAPGILWEGEFAGHSTSAVALPGVPAELTGMFVEEVRPLLTGTAAAVIRSHTLHVVGVGEPEVDRRLGELWRNPNPTVGVCARRGQLDVRLTAKAETAAGAGELLRDFSQRVRAALGPVVFGSDSVTLAQAAGALLRRAGWRLAVAESCTGGLIGDLLTDVPGSSDYLDRVLVTYANRAKTDLLGVPPEILARHGAVSRDTAALMAEGVRREAGVEVGLAVTGIAGPGGGTPPKPVGLVYLALADARGTEVRELRLGTERRSNKERAATAALALLWERLGGTEVRPDEGTPEGENGW